MLASGKREEVPRTAVIMRFFSREFTVVEFDDVLPCW
jgi:hypothetical protein